MTQTPQESKGQFVRFPVHLIYGCPGLSRDDKWVLLSIMGRYWGKGPHRLSYREIAALSGVPVSLLSSFIDKKTGKPHEGILDRIVRVTSYLQLEMRKAINPITRQPCKQPQTYVSIDYPRVWQDNLAYCESLKSVSYTNTSYEESVSYTNTTVSHVNSTVSNTNGSVSYTNKSVSVSRSKVAPIDYLDYLDITDTEESNCDDASAHPQHTPPSLQFVYRHDFNGRAFYYHDLCNSVQDKGCNDGMTFTLMRLADVPPDAQCDICYQSIHAEPRPFGETDTPPFAESEITHAALPALAVDAPVVDRLRGTGSGLEARLYSDSQGATALREDDELSTEGVDNYDEDVLAETVKMPVVRNVKGRDDGHQYSDGSDDRIERDSLHPGNDTRGAVEHPSRIAPAQQQSTPQRVAKGDDDAEHHPSGALELHGAGGHLCDDGDAPGGAVGMAQVDAARLTDTLSSGSAVPSDLPDVAASTPSDTSVASQSVSAMPPVVGARRRGKAEKPARPEKPTKAPEPTLEESMSEDEIALYHEWCSLFHVAVPLTPAIVKAAKTLAEPCAVWAGLIGVPRADVLKQMRGWEYSSNNRNGYFTRRGVKLYDLERDFEGWQSTMQQQMDEHGPQMTRDDDPPDYERPDGTMDYVKYVMYKARHPEHVAYSSSVGQS